MRCSLALCIAAGSVMAAPVLAQETVALTGRTLEFTADAAVPHARVELVDASGRRVAVVTSDSSGEFRFDRVRPGEYSIRATAAGFRDVVTPAFAAAAGEPVQILVRMGIDVVPLAPLEVVTRPVQLHANVALAGFLERSMRRMGGAFIQLEEIEERQPRLISDMLRTVGSFTVFDAAGGRSLGGTIFNNRTQCQPAVFIDNRLVYAMSRGRGGWTAYDWVNSVHWSEVAGIEIYSGVSNVPAQFSGSTAGCGVIAIWTRR
jgi:hypothetical protein